MVNSFTLDLTFDILVPLQKVEDRWVLDIVGGEQKIETRA